MSTIFTNTLRSYYIQSCLLKKIKASATDVFLGMYELFETAEAAAPGVPYKRCS